MIHSVFTTNDGLINVQLFLFSHYCYYVMFSLSYRPRSLYCMFSLYTHVGLPRLGQSSVLLQCSFTS